MMSEKYFLAKFFLKRIINHKHLPLLAMNISLLYGSSTASEKKKKKKSKRSHCILYSFRQVFREVQFTEENKKKTKLAFMDCLSLGYHRLPVKRYLQSLTYTSSLEFRNNSGNYPY